MCMYTIHLNVLSVVSWLPVSSRELLPSPAQLGSSKLDLIVASTEDNIGR